MHLNEDVVKGMMANGALNFKEEEGKFISKQTKELLALSQVLLTQSLLW